MNRYIIYLIFFTTLPLLCFADCNFCEAKENQNVDHVKKIREDRKKALAECQEKLNKYRLKRGGLVYDLYAEVMHARRYRREFTSDQWKTILLQKRVRIPLTAEDHRALQKLFLGEKY